MRSSNMLFGLLIMLGACALSFGAGYMVAKHDQPAPSPQVQTSDATPDPRPGNPEPDKTEAGTPPEVYKAPAPRPAPDTPEPGPAGPVANATMPLPTGLLPEGETHIGRGANDRDQAEELRDLRERLKELEKAADEPLDLFSPNAPKEAFTGTIRGTVLDGNGLPVSGARVHGTYGESMGSNTRMIRIAYGGRSDDGEVLATTDANGGFQIDVSREVSKGASVIANLTARADGHAESEQLSVTVKPGETKDGVVLKLRQAGSVSGRVVDESGAGVAGAVVSLATAGDGGGGMDLKIEMPGQRGKYSAVTDAAGDYRIEQVPHGKYTLRLEATGLRQVSGPTFVDAEAGKDTRASADFVVKATTSIKVQLRSTDGSPLRSWVTIELKDSAGKSVWKQQGMTDDQGTFATNDPPQGSYSAVIQAMGYQPETVAATITEGTPCDLGWITLRPAEGESGGPD